MNMLRLSNKTYFFLSILILIVFAAVLFFMGQPLICECGFVKLWHGSTVLTSENSQHISDWYTFSHVIHGFIFYWIAWLLEHVQKPAFEAKFFGFEQGFWKNFVGLAKLIQEIFTKSYAGVRRILSRNEIVGHALARKRGWPVGFMFLLALVAETSWELFENMDFIINRYRSITISFDYFGDSVINSTADALAMAIGFFLAWRLPVWVTVSLLVGMEVFVGYYIRDNLALNIIMLLYPSETILEWQRGG